MYVSTQPFKPTRKNFFLTAILMFGLSVATILSPETADGLTLSYWFFFGVTIYFLIGLIIIYGGGFRDSLFGLSECPHCNKLGWSIKEKFKISNNSETNLGRCALCNEKASISFFSGVPLIGAFLIWLLVVTLSDSISLACMAAYVWLLIYIFYFSRCIVIKR